MYLDISVRHLELKHGNANLQSACIYISIRQQNSGASLPNASSSNPKLLLCVCKISVRERRYNNIDFHIFFHNN